MTGETFARGLLAGANRAGTAALGRLALALWPRQGRRGERASYQPLPWLGLHDARRGAGTPERWTLLEPHIPADGAVLDVGCNAGYFVLKCAEKGALAWGVDKSLTCYLVARYARQKAGLANAHFFRWAVTPDNVRALPCFDVVLFMSVFHHWSKRHGFAAARAGLGELLAKGRRVIFEMGQAEMAPKYNLPHFGGDAVEGLRGLLAGLTDRPVIHLGATAVDAAYGRETAARHLFRVG
jgi:SAM-dependent methyltransferase